MTLQSSQIAQSLILLFLLLAPVREVKESLDLVLLLQVHVP